MALLSTLVDTFSAGIGSLWTKAGDSTAQVTAVSGGVQIAHTAASQYNELDSVASYDLTGSYAYLEITSFGNQSLVSHEVYMKLHDVSANSGLMFVAGNNNLSAWRDVSGTRTQVGSYLLLNTTTHRWLRIRESGGTTFWDTAPDGTTWTNRWSIANPITITTLQVQIQCGCWQTESSGSQMTFDNFNTLGAADTGRFFMF